MAFPPDVLERIRSHYVLSTLIGRFIPLKRHGREFMGLCPFHQEKTPSFTVNDQKGFYHCFGCAAHGDVIEFIKRYEHLGYREAVEKLAREAGIPLPVQTPEAAAAARARATLIDVMEAACRWFENNLQRTEAMAAREYLRTRGITPATQQQFRIGYAPDRRDGLKVFLTQQGIEESQLREAGLIIRPEGSAAYDRFRSRIIIPIRDIRGKVIAFGGRLMDANARNAPKYLNSPETPLFKKGEVLFNLDKAGQAARERGEIYVVEGYMDAIMMVQAGFPASVATLGTAVTEAHLRMLWNHTPEPVLCLDGDAAGARAMWRAAELALPLLTPGNNLRFARLPAGEDPDSLIRHHGNTALTHALQEAKGLSETLWQHCAAEAPKTPEGRSALEHKLMGFALRIKDATVQRHVRAYFRQQIWPQKTVVADIALRSTAVERQARSTLQDTQLMAARQLLKLVLLQPAVLHRVEAEEHFACMECVNDTLSALREALLTASHEPALEDPIALYTHLHERGFAHVMTALLKDDAVQVPRRATDSAEQAFRIWQQVVASHQLAALEIEYKLQETAVTQAPEDEAALTRLLALQTQLKEMKSAHRFTTRMEESEG